MSTSMTKATRSRNQPLVSVNIIFLDAGDVFFVEAIDSVLTQTYPDWELLLVDDGSTDGSTGIARAYAEQYPDKIRYLEHIGHENCGMSATRNLGLRHAQGTFVGFLDADDVWLPDKLEQQVSRLERDPAAAMVYGRTMIWYGWHPDFSDGSKDRFYDLGVEPDSMVAPPYLATILLRNRTQTPTTCNALLRRDAVAAVGGFEDAFRGMFEDQVFFVKVELAFPVIVADECWAKYRQHPHNRSAVGRNTPAYRAVRLRYLQWVEEYLVAQRIESREVWRTLRSELRPLRYPRAYRLAALMRRVVGRSRTRVVRLLGG